MALDNDLRRGRHSVYDLHVHLVFVTKYRRRVFTAEHLCRLQEVFASVCSDAGAGLEEFNGKDNHVHLLVSFPPDVPLSRLVNSLKAVSSRRLRAEFPEVKNVCWNGKKLWTPGYYAGTTGGAGIDTVRRYIEQQDTPA
ncbi:IS200/IS605 family transposase [Corynebacterium bovis]|uniref:IS200/IS605 family transposase n=1 Tax=Corynebacterium bovis TaxID=36808 RepID=UPI0031393636